MKKLAIISSAVIGLLYAADTVPNNFTSGEIIKASEINANFDHLSNLITLLRSQIELLSNSNGNRKFVGLSSESVRGDAGILNVNNACHATFPGSTICTLDEVYNSANPTDYTGEVWVEPTSCQYFTNLLNSYNSAATVNKLALPDGKSTSTYCTRNTPIACCK